MYKCINYWNNIQYYNGFKLFSPSKVNITECQYINDRETMGVPTGVKVRYIGN